MARRPRELGIQGPHGQRESTPVSTLFAHLPSPQTMVLVALLMKVSGWCAGLGSCGVLTMSHSPSPCRDKVKGGKHSLPSEIWPSALRYPCPQLLPGESSEWNPGLWGEGLQVAPAARVSVAKLVKVVLCQQLSLGGSHWAEGV